MKILILTPQLPYPPHQGTTLRNYHILRGLADAHDLTLLSYVEPGQQTTPAEMEPLLALCTAVKTVPTPPHPTRRRLQLLATSREPDMAHRLRDSRHELALRRLLAENAFDIVQIEGIELAHLIPTIRAVSPRSRIVFDDHNAETELQRLAFEADRGNPRRWAAAAYSRVQVARLSAYEAWACRSADHVVAVSDSDRESLRALLGDESTPIGVIPNCIDVASYRPDPAALADAPRFDLVFSGKMDYRPNIDAVLWFADEVWPEILAQRPSTTFAIVGQKPHARLDRLRDVAGITVTGRVPEVAPYLWGTAVVVMPFRVGSGTRLKLIEAMAAGLAVVSTAVGAAGFPVVDGRELVLVETGAEMATAVVGLLEAPEERARLGRAAREFADQYDWRRVVPAFSQIYADLLDAKQAR